MTSATHCRNEGEESSYAKIAYRLYRDADGYPPVSIELLNAVAISAGVYRIENAPFFVKDVSYHDVVRARKSDGLSVGQFEFLELLEGSDFSSISIIVIDSSVDSLLMGLFRGMQCVLEYGEFGRYRVLAVAVPAAADYASIRAKLVDLEERGVISFSELALAHDI